MILLPFLALHVVVPPVPGPIGRQQLPASGCAAYLWGAGDATKGQGVIAMAGADPARLRLALDGAPPVDLPNVAQRGATAFGLAEVGDYRLGAVTATLTMTIATRADLRDGAAVPQATLSIARAGSDEMVVPLAGLIGCAVPR